MITNEKIELGKTGIRVSPLGLGAWQWGDQMMWEYGKSHTDEDIAQAFTLSLDAGVNFIDTAEVYGLGKSERMLGKLVKSLPAASDQVIVASKFFPFPWRLSKGRLYNALKHSLERLQMSHLDLYQIHWPFQPVPIETWANALADVVAAGLTRAVGVSNYNPQQMRRSYLALKARGVVLASNQVHFSLLQREPERSGLLELCQELGITLIAYSPLEKGMLTGKYSPENIPSGLRGRTYNGAYLEKIQPLIHLLREIGVVHGGKTPGQVALNWAMCKGALVIPGAKNARQAIENAAALGWRLDAEEMDVLDRTSAKVLG